MNALKQCHAGQRVQNSFALSVNTLDRLQIMVVATLTNVNGDRKGRCHPPGLRGGVSIMPDAQSC